jgi:conjugative transfer signal peptidase TraF
MATRPGRLVKGCVLIVAGLASLFQLFGWTGLRLNSSPSLPVGLYIETSASDLAEFCPPEPWGRFAAARGYRAHGICRDGATPLLKPIVARPGDRIDVSAAGVRVNGELVPNSAPRSADSKNRRLPSFPAGSRVVEPETVWLVSSYSDRSFDSRYMGPIPKSCIRAYLRPLITLW